MKRKLITPLDLSLIVLVVFVCGVFAFLNLFSEDGNKVVITVDESVVAELELDVDQTKKIKNQYGYNYVVIKNKECFVSKADCRDGICVEHSAVNKVGQSIVCLPHKLIVEIK